MKGTLSKIASVLLPSALLCLLICLSFLGADAADAKAAELIELQKNAPNGVVHLDVNGFNKYVTGRKRSYTMIIFLTASHLLDKENLNLRAIRKEFGYLANTHLLNSKETEKAKVFFGEIEFSESQELFHRLGANVLPYIFHVPADMSIGADGAIKLSDSDVMRTSDYTNYPWTANDMAAFVKEASGIDLGPINRPSIKGHPLAPVAGLFILAGLGIVGYQLVIAEWTKNVVVLAIGATVVYAFSVSGAMHNIIRGVPMYYFDPKDRHIVMFMPGGQGQLGAEGFIMGGMYTVFGLSLAALSFACPKIADKSTRRGCCYGALALAFYCFYKIVQVYTWKTGYHLRLYL